MMALFRDRLKSRGARGIIGLQRTFKIMDDDNSRTLSQYEFTKACRDFKIGIADENMHVLFKAFDRNNDGVINFDEFLYSIRGELSKARMDLIKHAFQKLDRDASGFIELSDIKGLYRAERHPDVIGGKKTED